MLITDAAMKRLAEFTAGRRAARTRQQIVRLLCSYRIDHDILADYTKWS